MTTDLLHIEARLRAIASPVADEALLERIVASRATGVRVVLPLDPPKAPTRWRQLAIGGAVAAAVVFALIPAATDPRVPTGELPAPWEIGWLMPSAAAAQLSTPAFAPITRLDASRMRAGEWKYDVTTYGDGGFHRHSGSTTIAVHMLGSGADSPWLLTTTRVRPAGTWIDSLVVRRDDLRPLSRTVHHWKHDSEPVYAFASDSLTAAIPSANVRVTRALPAIASRPYLAELDGLLPALALTTGWRHSVPLLQPFIGDPPFYALDLAVVGEETIRVPAGTFRCLRVELSLGGKAIDTRWVSAEDGRLVRRRGVNRIGIWDEEVLVP